MSGPHNVRASAVAALAIIMSLFASGPADAADGVAVHPASPAVQAVETKSAGVQPDDDVVDPEDTKSGRPVQPLIGIGIMGLILVVGLRAIKRQRDEGRRSKLPPIG